MSYKIQMLAGTQTAKLSLYGPLDYWDNLGTKFVQDVNNLGAVEQIDVHINCPGGIMGDGVAIYNVLKQHDAKIRVVIDALAASAASLVAMAGDEIVMPNNTLMMIHEPEAMAWGRSDDMLKAAEILEAHLETAVRIYKERTGLQDDEIRNMLAEETWFTAEQALEKGFCTEVIESYKVAAFYDPEKVKFKNAPVEALAKLMEEPAMAGEETPKTYNALPVMEAVSAAGLPAVVAVNLVRREADAAAVASRIAECTEITNLCGAANLPKLSGPLLKSEVSALEAKEIVAEINAVIDERAPTNSSNGGGDQGEGDKPKEPKREPFKKAIANANKKTAS